MIPGNLQTDSNECSKRFLGTFEMILGNATKDFEEYSRRFPGNIRLDLFRKILLAFIKFCN